MSGAAIALTGRQPEFLPRTLFRWMNAAVTAAYGSPPPPPAVDGDEPEVDEETILLVTLACMAHC